MKRALALVMLLLSCARAQAGAWTQDEDKWQVISTLILSNADRSYDGHAAARSPVTFERALLQNSADYGWNDHLTLFARVETAYAHFRDAYTPPVTALDNALEAGARLRLMNDAEDDGILSLEGSLRTAGAFNFAISANSLASGRSAELRLLYGRNFRWQGMDGFLDVEAGERFLSRPRPSETPIDLTAGLWIDADTMAMVQSFNLVGAGGDANPYPYFRSHKIELSAVRKLSPRYSLQAGAFFSPAGQNALVEQGLCLSLWAQF